MLAKKKNNQTGEALGSDSTEALLRRERKANSAWAKLRRNKTAMVGLVIVLVMIFLAVFAPLLCTYDPNKIDIANMYLKPGQGGHIFGTDEVGRDLFARCLYGARVSLIVAFGGTVVAGIIGVLLGLIAGYCGGVVDSVIMRIMDGMLAFPYILMAIILMTVLGSGMFNVILAIGIGNVPSFARVIRGEVHIIKNEEYCNASRAIGVSRVRMMFTHILPNTVSPLIVYATLGIAGAIISEAALSFLGLGISTPTASWGSILRSGKEVLNTSPHLAFISGGFILVTVLGFNLFGDGLRDVLDPKMKQ
ncbi:MAG: ABC transporter permease [Lachnospiraceae bacterium]|nr:ABC transporter permease [Lachnospiraceae bacterium]